MLSQTLLQVTVRERLDKASGVRIVGVGIMIRPDVQPHVKTTANVVPDDLMFLQAAGALVVTSLSCRRVTIIELEERLILVRNRDRR